MKNNHQETPSPEEYASTAATLFLEKGQRNEMELLLKSEVSMTWYNQDFGVNQYHYYLRLPLAIYRQIMDAKHEYETSIGLQLNELATPYYEEVNVKIVPIPEATEDWRKNFTTLSQSAFGFPPQHTQYEADIFMIMPFQNGQLQQVFEDHIQTVSSKLGMTIKRGDNFFTAESIMRDIWGAINSAKLIIAECTGRNTNVFYELGIAHTLGRPTIVITQNSDDIPFDIRHGRYIKYEFIPRGMEKFEHDLTDAIQKILNSKNQSVASIDEDDIPF